MRAVVFSTYELGRQPFGLASAASALQSVGLSVTAHDLSVHGFSPEMVQDADLVGFYVPMHTATRLAEPLIRRTRDAVPGARIVVFGLYARMNETLLREAGASEVLGPEFEPGLQAFGQSVVDGLAPARAEPSPRTRFVVPDRRGLPSLDLYARFRPIDGSERLAGATEATRGCKHHCRHCPIVPEYGGRFVVVPPEVVAGDVRTLVAAGAEHITFGDPDFFNGPTHALRVVRALHAEHPGVTYDVTIKVEHLARHIDLLPELVATGCALVTSAVESFDPTILDRFDKRHAPQDFERVLGEMRRIGLPLNPTFVAFTPWTTVDGYLAFLTEVARLGLVGNVAPIQYAIRLLIPAGSLLLELEDVAGLVEPFDPAGLVHPWRHPDPAVDDLQRSILALVGERSGDTRSSVFAGVWEIAASAAGSGASVPLDEAVPIATVPYLTEPWYC